ncbi:MAG: dihydropteroate synthase [Deltaproteobacteria bacterium]|nr:dihydropteroate synthase [Deltaproteobacteria bacterium]
MAEKAHIPLGVGFYPDWFNENYGISFDRKYYFDPETRVEARMEIERSLHERFGEFGLGSANPEPKPLITFGMVMLPAIFGCEIVFEDGALPWAMPLNLSDEEIMKLEVPDIFNTSPMKEMIGQIDYLKEKYGRVVGDINTTGVQNLALKIRGDQLYYDFFEKPDLCHHLLRICAECVLRLFDFNRRTTGTGAMDVTPMADPELCILPNCTAEQISLQTYEEFILPYDNQVADTCKPIGIHHCGSVDEVLAGYAKVRHLRFLEIGFGSDVRKTRDTFGPEVAVNARISPVLMKNGTPEEVAAEVKRLIDCGAPLSNFSIDTVGLTHGTPDENVKAALRTAAEYGKIPRDRGEKEETKPRVFAVPGKKRPPVETSLRSASRTVTIGPDHPLVLIGERINPTGRKDLARALESGDLERIRSEALKQVEAGADILDVNVGVSGIDEAQVMAEAVRAIQEVTDAPLCIDSALPEAIEAGLSAFEGKALVNSVNGEEKKLRAVLPLVREHGAAVIGLTMDDQGIPKKAEDRLRIASRILERSLQEGIPRQDLIIDPLAMAVSADFESARETLEALRLIREELGVNLTLGLSNVSFGLPRRSAINATFLAMAMMNGLTCPIVDPTSEEMRLAVLAADMLLGRDRHCGRFLAVQAKEPEQVAAVPTEKEPDSESALLELEEAVIHGNRQQAVELTRLALDGRMDPQAIIDRHLIPALNAVGERFERKEIFIPEMMIAARTMQACLDLIKPLLERETEKVLGTMVIGTVFGDLHDIGKNLVKLLLKTSGFRVVDLGENVPPQNFLEAAREHEADIVGLSSLLTTGDPHVRETVRVLKESDLGDRVKIICGGAAMTGKFVQACGADAYARDAAEGVKKSKELLGVE